MVKGCGSFRRSFMSRMAKTARICSKRKATSLPFLSPPSVMTVKCAERISSQGDGSAAGAGVDVERKAPRRIAGTIESVMERVRTMRIPPRNGLSKMLPRGGTWQPTETRRCGITTRAVRGGTSVRRSGDSRLLGVRGRNRILRLLWRLRSLLPKSRIMACPLLVNEDVAGFNVAMNDFFGMSGVQPVGNFDGERDVCRH